MKNIARAERELHT